MTAQHGADAFQNSSELCLTSIRTAIEFTMDSSVKAKKSKATQFQHARDNAIAALGKVIKHQANKVDINQLMPYWLSLLPLTHDMDEAKI